MHFPKRVKILFIRVTKLDGALVILKVHHHGFVSTVFGSESSFRDILVGYSNLIVFSVKIDFRKYSGSTQMIQQFTDQRKRVLVFHGNVI